MAIVNTFGQSVNVQAVAFARWLLAAIEKGDGTWCSMERWEMEYNYEDGGRYLCPTIRIDMTLNTPDMDGLHAAFNGQFDEPEETATEGVEIYDPNTERGHRIRRARQRRRARIDQASIDAAVQTALEARATQQRQRSLREKLIEILMQHGLVASDEVDLDIDLGTDIDTGKIKRVSVKRKVKW